jgi:PAS domain S-box-containing protein
MTGYLIKKRNHQLCTLEKAIDAVADGELHQSTELKGSERITALGRSFNHMSYSLELDADKMRREHNRFRSILHGITDGIIIFDRMGRVLSANPAAEVALGIQENDIKGKWHIGIPEIERLMTAKVIVSDELKMKCWVAKKCAKKDCPSYESKDLRCWLQCGTWCHNEIQGTFSQKRDACERCDVYMKNGISITDFKREGRDYSVTISSVLNDQGHEEGRMAVLHDDTEARAAAEALRRRNRDLSVINDVGSALFGSIGDIDEVLCETLTRLADSVNANAGALLIKNSDSSSMHLVAHTGFSPQASIFLNLIEVTGEIEGMLDSESGLIDVERLFGRNKSMKLMLERESLDRPIIAPVWANGNVIGIMALFDSSWRDYNDDDIKLITAVAAQFGVTLRNQHLFESITKAKKAWETTFDSMTDAVSVHDADHKIVRVNRAMAELLGSTKEDLAGKKCYEVIHKLDSPIRQCPSREVFRSGKSVSLEIEEQHLDKEFRLSVNPIFNSEGEVAGLVHVMRDITERKQLRHQLLQSEKMAAIGQLVSGVAHELNNPLTGVIGYSQMMMQRSGKDDNSQEAKDLKIILSEAQRASRIVQNLLSFARKYQPQKNFVDINEALRTVMDLRAYELNVSNIKVEADFDPDLPRTMADLHQIEQVLLNVLNNAEQSIASTGRPGVIRITSQESKGLINIIISDNGEGIAVEDINRIFDPFFTTKEVGKGTGLGLSICYGIIEEHGGEIRVESKKGNGATFIIELPVTESSTTNVEQSGRGAGSNEGSRRRVLLVDDEPAIIELLTDILTMDGHGVDVARNSRIAMLKLSSFSYDNIITETNMQHGDGRDLHKRIRDIDPSLAANVIFITDDSIGSDTREYVNKTGNAFLEKPFNLHDLRELLNKVMNKNG